MSHGSDWNAGLYDDKHSFVWKMATGLLELLEAKTGESVLDIGCGTGHLTAQIAATGAKVVGVDRSPEMIQQARDEYPALRFEVMDAREMDFQESFDAVFSNATLHWIQQPEQVITGIRKALRPGGRFVAEFGGHGNVGELLSAIGRVWQSFGLPEPAPNPWYYPSISEYSGLLELLGMEVTFATLFDRPTPLEDGEQGLSNWLKMFGATIVEKFPPGLREEALAAVEQQARPALLRGGQWVMDYRRLRVVARKPHNLGAR